MSATVTTVHSPFQKRNIYNNIYDTCIIFVITIILHSQSVRFGCWANSDIYAIFILYTCGTHAKSKGWYYILSLCLHTFIQISSHQSHKNKNGIEYEIIIIVCLRRRRRRQPRSANILSISWIRHDNIRVYVLYPEIRLRGILFIAF